MLTREVDHSLDRLSGVGEAGMDVAGTVHDAVVRGGERARDAADVLHGTWLGHPLHPALTDLTIGAWTFGAVFDAIGAVQGSEAARQAGDRLAALGTAAAVPTALSGMADYSAVDEPASTTATLHGLMNAANLGLYALSLRDRRTGDRGRGLFYSAVALASTAVSAWLGGHLVYRERVGVDHSEDFTGPEDWQPVLAAAELPPREPRRVEVDGKGVLLYRDDEGVHALGSVCSHAGGPLEDGGFHDACVQCPWHDSVFDVRDGSVVHGPATHPQPVFDTRVRDGRIEIRLLED